VIETIVVTKDGRFTVRFDRSKVLAETGVPDSFSYGDGLRIGNGEGDGARILLRSFPPLAVSSCRSYGGILRMHYAHGTMSVRKLRKLARATGLEPATCGSTIHCSNQLSYAPARAVKAA
jgi:hypothetical protein